MNRNCSPELDQILDQEFKVLDHGFVRVVDYMGNDGSIVQAARVSYGKGTKTVNEDRGLIRYLMRHRHTTPFEMCVIKLHMKMPIFVARQFVRHRTASLNEYSGRYSVMDSDFYIPEKLSVQSQANKQGRGETIRQELEDAYLTSIDDHSYASYNFYQELLNEDLDGNIIDENKVGIARELARMVLPVNFYTQWYWQCNLHNLLHFLSLRADPHAQEEARAYANVMCDIVAKWVPMTWEAFLEYRKNAISFSATEKKLIQQMISGQVVGYEGSGLSKREWEEFKSKIDFPHRIAE